MCIVHFLRFINSMELDEIREGATLIVQSELFTVYEGVLMRFGRVLCSLCKVNFLRFIKVYCSMGVRLLSLEFVDSRINAEILRSDLD